MYLLELADVTAGVQEIAFGLSIIISGMFLLAYRNLAQEQERQEMLDNFLQD
jgi:hypothetical protein